MLQRLSNRLVGELRTLLRRGALFVLTGFTAIFLAVSPLATPTASAAILDSFSLGGNSCAIETVGWVICPTMRTIARMADKGFTYINKNSLSLNYQLFGNTGKTFQAWEVMRNIANLLFVAIFLYIIYGYLIGRTGGTYSFKRLLPRMIIIAILVNSSYYIGAIFIDIANILGDSLWDILKNIYGNGSPVLPLGGSANPLMDGNLTKMTAAALGNTMMVWVLLPPIAAVTITIAVICAAAVILIIMRETIIATLILASPVLIVLQLMPNMERVSSQAMRIFLQLLMLYPIIALLLGTGQIVSLAAGSWNGPAALYGGGTGNILPDLVAAAAAVVPILGIWFIFKHMSSIMSAAGTRLSANIAGRRGSKNEEKARVTGNATAGATGNKNTGGLLGSLSRRPSYSRSRRHSSLGGSTMPNRPRDSNNLDKPGDGGMGGDGGTGGAGGVGGIGGDGGMADIRPQVTGNAMSPMLSSDDLSAQLEGQQAARTESETKDGGVDTGELAKALSSSDLQTHEKESEKQVTAKDLFSSLNKDHGHNSKDKERKFGAGPEPAGGSGGSSSGQPSAPIASYNAPQMAQSNSIVSGTSAPQQSAQIVAIPVQVDASTLLGQNHPPDNVSQPPISGTEEKAKARAQKYLFDAENDLNKDRDAQDILGHDKQDRPTEQPHISVKHDSEKEDES